MLLAIAGHDLRQPLQVIQSAHEFLSRNVRTTSELRQLRSSKIAIDRLRDQLDELVAALQLREHVKGAKLTPVRVGPLLEQATCEIAVAAQRKGVSVRTAPTSATIESDSLLLGTVLRNLVSNAVKYTQLGGPRPPRLTTNDRGQHSEYALKKVVDAIGKSSVRE